ncbi:MAG: multicomponent Na+:H+ antiporter subunit F [Kiritimatiellia bacterium]|jgi:multicomponent Na+:H+ antiporter subunit F
MRLAYAITMCVILLSMSLILIRAFRGPSLYDRVLAVNSFGTMTVLFIAVLGYLEGRPEFMDVALIYALINFIGTVAVLKYFKFGDLAHAGRQNKDETLPSNTSLPS